MVCKIIFCSEFPDIPDQAGKKTRRRRSRRTQSIAKRYAFHANAIKELKQNFNVQIFSLLKLYVGKAESSILVVFTCPGEATNVVRCAI